MNRSLPVKGGDLDRILKKLPRYRLLATIFVASFDFNTPCLAWPHLRTSEALPFLDPVAKRFEPLLDTLQRASSLTTGLSQYWSIYDTWRLVANSYLGATEPTKCSVSRTGWADGVVALDLLLGLSILFADVAKCPCGVRLVLLRPAELTLFAVWLRFFAFESAVRSGPRGSRLVSIIPFPREWGTTR